jgi:DNA invertase Pin-like site-specific DNA recombinase
MKAKLAERRWFEIAKEHEDQGVSGGKGGDKRPRSTRCPRDAMRCRLDILLARSMDRLGRSVLPVDAASVQASSNVAAGLRKEGHGPMKGSFASEHKFGATNIEGRRNW